jgi:1-deoxy-D-xylulose-5-phosphate reductoisomerase
MTEPSAATDLRAQLHSLGLKTEVLSGPEALDDVARAPEVDMVMAAIVGSAGLSSCLAAALSGKKLLLANKEALVVGGEVFLQAVKRGQARLLPIDSEHSAIFQSLPEDSSTWSERVDKIILTASGGPFRTWALDAIENATVQEACAHPTWVMGRKISVDSATMMNKALEVIEAHYLFGIDPSKIEVVIHPQSVIHSMVQFKDASVVAQLGTPDMRVPIAYGLSWPARMDSGAKTLDFSSLSAMTFESFDDPTHRSRYPGLALAFRALEHKAGMPGVLNAANEEAVQAFLDGRIAFGQIHQINLSTLEAYAPKAPVDLADLLGIDQEARQVAQARIKAIQSC